MIFALLGWKGGHHWDEYFYLYSSFMHTPRELLQYELATGVFPPGFFTEKIGHVALLRLITRMLGSGEPVLYEVEALYTLMLGGYFWAAYRLLRELFGPGEARDSTLVLMLSPVALYLAYKMLSEAPSILFVTLACWTLVRSFTGPTRRSRRAALALTAPLLALGALFRITSVVGFTGLGLALLVVKDPRVGRARLLGTLILTGTAAATLYALALQSLGASPLRIFGGVDTVVTTHPAGERLFALACFLQTFLVALPFAWPERDRSSVRLAFAWLLCAAFPFLAGHEPRYYAPALVPFALLCSVGLRAAAAKIPRVTARHAWLGLLGGLAVINRALLIPLMPYEVKQEQLLGLFHRLHHTGPEASYLVPWISDYSLLRFSSPDARILLCVSLLPGGRIESSSSDSQLKPADQWWVGLDHYVGSRAELMKQPQPWKYLGWTYNPADLELLQLVGHFGLNPSRIGTLHNHLTESWVWFDPSLRLDLSVRGGMYFAYDVKPRS